MSRQLLDLPRGPVEVWQSGKGPTVLAAPGCGYGGSYRITTWLAHELPDHHVVSVSRPGYGQTPLATATTFHEQAAMYIDVLDAIGVADCVVVGMSASGPIALLAARDHAPRIRGLVLWCAVARGLASHRIAEEDANLDPDFLEKEQADERATYAQMLSDESFAREALPVLLRPAEIERYTSDPLVRKNIRSYLDGHLAAPAAAAAVRNDMVQLGALLHEGVDSRVPVPTLIMHGDGDDVVPVAHARYHAAVNPSAHLEVVPGAGHGFMLTFRPQVMTTVCSFLNQVDRSA